MINKVRIIGQFLIVSFVMMVIGVDRIEARACDKNEHTIINLQGNEVCKRNLTNPNKAVTEISCKAGETKFFNIQGVSQRTTCLGKCGPGKVPKLRESTGMWACESVGVCTKYLGLWTCYCRPGQHPDLSIGKCV